MGLRSYLGPWVSLGNSWACLWEEKGGEGTPPESTACSLMLRAFPLLFNPSLLVMQWPHPHGKMNLKAKQEEKIRAARLVFLPIQSCLVAFPGPRPHRKPVSSPSAVSPVPLLLPPTHKAHNLMGIYNILVCSSGLGLRSRHDWQSYHFPVPTWAIVWPSECGSSCLVMTNLVEAMPPHSLTKASCVACVWRQGPGAGTDWILSSAAGSDECVAGYTLMFRVTALRS